MRRKKFSVKKTLMGIGILFLFIGIVLFVSGIISISYTKEMRENSETTEAVIVDIEYSRRKKGVNRKPVVEYTVGGVEYNRTLNEYNSGMSIGDKITVYYDPDHPADVSSGSMSGPIIVTCIGGLFVIIGGAFAAAVIFSFGKRRKLIASGEPMTGVITDVKMNVSVKINGRHPYKIECEVNDPYTNERYLYSSENITEDVSALIGSDITVYVDKENRKKYYVDVRGLMERYNEENNIHDFR